MASHSFTVSRCLLLKIEVGVASWIGGIGPGEYFSMVLQAGCLPIEEQSFSTSSGQSEIVSFLMGWAFALGGGGGPIPSLH